MRPFVRPAQNGRGAGVSGLASSCTRKTGKKHGSMLWKTGTHRAEARNWLCSSIRSCSDLRFCCLKLDLTDVNMCADAHVRKHIADGCDGVALEPARHVKRERKIMAECEKLKVCPFFRDELAYMPRTADQMKLSYCLGDNRTCARYMVISKGVPPPTDLYPNQRDRVPQILVQLGKQK